LVPGFSSYSFGKFFYCPNAKELQVLPTFSEKDDLYPPFPFWTKFTSKNETYFYNHIQYLYAMSTGYKPGDPPSKRILYLMSKLFARWHSTWWVYAIASMQLKQTAIYIHGTMHATYRLVAWDMCHYRDCKYTIHAFLFYTIGDALHACLFTARHLKPFIS